MGLGNNTQTKNLLTRRVDFRPGTLPIDIFPVLMRLPHWLQPWRKLANQIVGREHELYNIFLDHLRAAEISGSTPDCFGLTLLKVGFVGLIAQH